MKDTWMLLPHLLVQCTVAQLHQHLQGAVCMLI
jgi:hypothetical protein